MLGQKRIAGAIIQALDRPIRRLPCNLERVLFGKSLRPGGDLLMAKFDYKRPTSLAKCLTILKEGDDHGKIIAGGTDLMVEIRAGKEKDLAYVVDVTHIEDLKGIVKNGD